MIGTQPLLLPFLPDAALRLIPSHIILFFFLQSCIILLQSLNFKLGIAVGAFQFLCLAVKADAASAAGTFVFL